MTTPREPAAEHDATDEVALAGGLALKLALGRSLGPHHPPTVRPNQITDFEEARRT